MKLSAVIDNYVNFKRGMGMRLSSEAIMLSAFGKAMGDIDIGQVKPRAVQFFFDCKRPVTTTLRQYFWVLSSFYRYAVGRGFATSIPLPATLPKIPPPPAHYIYTVDEIRRLLAATAVLRTPWSPWRPQAFRTFLLLLYGTGLRLAEALALTLRDVDLANAVVTVHQGKFFKSRVVPIGPKLTRALADYANHRRRRHPMPDYENSAFFADRRGRRWDQRATQIYFRKVCRRAQVVRQGRGQQPRLHDIRHATAQHRIEAWYRSGADVQLLLPQLATFLGHRDITSLQYYLHMTPELLRAAARRFQSYAQP